MTTFAADSSNLLIEPRPVARIAMLATLLPVQLLSNETLAALHPEWLADKIPAKTGIHERHIPVADETAGDLRLKTEQQHKLGLPRSAGALHINLLYSNYPYGLSLATIPSKSSEHRQPAVAADGVHVGALAAVSPTP